VAQVESGSTIEERIGGWIDSFVACLERTRLSVLMIFIYVVLVSLIRDLSEYFLLDQEFVTTSHPWIFSIAHHVSFFVVVFLGLVILLSAFTNSGVRRVVNYICTFWWIIILPPWIDHYLGGLDQNYQYFSPTEFIDAILHFSGTNFNIGQAMEVVVVLFGLFAYGLWTQRRELGTVAGRVYTAVRLFFLVLFTMITMFIMATPALFLPVGSEGGVPVFPAFDLTKFVEFHLFLVTYYLLMGIALVIGIIYIANREHFRSILRSMRLPQTLFFGGIVAAGIVTGWRSSCGLYLVTDILQDPFYINLGYAVIAIVSAVIAWQVGTMWNDITDREVDELDGRRTVASGLLPHRPYLEFSLVLAIVSLSLAALLSVEQFLIMLAILTLAWAYSFRPLRFKENVLSPFLMGMGTFLALMYGAMTPYRQILFFDVDPPVPYVTGDIIVPGLGPEGFLLGLFVFVGLVVGSMIMDIEGYEEDRRAGVRTIYTSMGLDRGQRLVSVLIFLTSLTPLAIFQRIDDLLIFPLLGVVASYLFWRHGSARWVMIVAFMGLLYAALRYLNLI
jgi:4-hydroxybenzoate polyprenyltransferase